MIVGLAMVFVSLRFYGPVILVAPPSLPCWVSLRGESFSRGLLNVAIGL